ncbi:hypothetical protein BJ742DRAFT_854894, partial [Cladochytrium replicatum]
MLFVPGWILREIHGMAYITVMKCDIDLRKDLLSNSVISGRTTFVPGMAGRLQREITALDPTTMKPNVIFPSRTLVLVATSTPKKFGDASEDSNDVPQQFYSHIYEVHQGIRGYMVSIFGAPQRPNKPAEVKEFLDPVENFNSTLCFHHHHEDNSL